MPSLCLNCFAKPIGRKGRPFCGERCWKDWKSPRRAFYRKVKKTTGCWLWRGSFFENGYGQFRGQKAHRVAWELTHGPIPEGLKVLHRCDVKKCVRFGHLFLGTTQDNSDDMKRKGRQHRPKGSKNNNAKLTERIVRRILALYKSGVRQTDLAYQFDLSFSRVSTIVNRKGWRHVSE